MQPAQEPYPLPPVVRRERPQQQQQQQEPYQQQPMSSMEEEMDAYFDNEDEFVSDRPTIVEKVSISPTFSEQLLHTKVFF
jgi:hypothetical protein